MGMKRSPLLIPAARGVTFRVVLSILFIALSLWIAAVTFDGLKQGSLIWPRRFGSDVWVHQSTEPIRFRVAAVAWFTVCIWLFYVSIVEIFYARSYRKRRSPSP